MNSRNALLIVSFIWVVLGGLYYPKWKMAWTEAAISFDVSGYYHYLPAIFIYGDLKQQAWMNEINKQYLPSTAYDQAFVHANSGNRINKYPIGQAILYSPFFFAAHLYARVTNAYPADGYSRPYQFAIWVGGLAVSILGLFLLRRILITYVEDSIAALTLLTLGIGTNWMEYASISNGMNHTWLFALLCALVLLTIRFYRRQDWLSSVGIGLCIGMAGLVRPTEIIWVLVPLLWGFDSFQKRISFLMDDWKKILVALLCTGGIMLIQPLYWKYISGEWLVYTYGEQRFDWLHPKVWTGLLSVNTGWWIYSPIMFLPLFGFAKLYRTQRDIFWSMAVTCFLSLYITFAWPYWQSGGGLGQRNLIQLYPLLSIPLAMTIKKMMRTNTGRWIWYLMFSLNIYYSVWWVHQAHRGGFFQPGQMTWAYFQKIVGKVHPDPDAVKLMDTHEWYRGIPNTMPPVFTEDFEDDTAFCVTAWPNGGKAACLNQEQQFLGPFEIPVIHSCGNWLIAEADFIIQSREWDAWKYTQWIVQFHREKEVIKTNQIRIQRLQPVDRAIIHLDFAVKLPKEAFTKCTMTFWNAESIHTVLVDNVRLTCVK